MSEGDVKIVLDALRDFRSEFQEFRKESNGRLRNLEGAYERSRGAMAVVGFMGLTGLLAFLGWLAKLAGLIRP